MVLFFDVLSKAIKKEIYQNRKNTFDYILARKWQRDIMWINRISTSTFKNILTLDGNSFVDNILKNETKYDQSKNWNSYKNIFLIDFVLSSN